MGYRSLFMLLLISLPYSAIAQKAYELEHYRGKIQNKTVKLELGNGYIGASRILLPVTGHNKPLLFLPESGTPDSPFILRNTKKDAEDYFVLNNMHEAYETLPAVITGHYRVDKKTIPVKFYLVK